MSTSEPRTKPEPARDEPWSLRYPPRIPSLLMFVGPIVAAAAVAGVVVLAALTSWWVLFALPPLMMMVCGPVMMTAMRGAGGHGFPAAGWCPPWWSFDTERATRAD